MEGQLIQGNCYDVKVRNPDGGPPIEHVGIEYRGPGSMWWSEAHSGAMDALVFRSGEGASYVVVATESIIEAQLCSIRLAVGGGHARVHRHQMGSPTD